MQPMETAPKDRPILLWQQDISEVASPAHAVSGWIVMKRERRVVGGEWVVGEWDGTRAYLSYACSAADPEIDNPVGWEELPQAPELEE